MKAEKTRNISFQTYKHHKENEGEWVVTVSKSFGTNKCGGKAQALLKAQEFRAWVYGLMFRKMKEDYVRENVGYRECQPVPGGKIYRYYRAGFYVDGVKKEKFFNIDKLGRERAKELAKKKADIGKRWNLMETYARESL